MDSERLETMKRIILSDSQIGDLYNFLGICTISSGEDISDLMLDQKLSFLTSAVLGFIRTTDSELVDLNKMIETIKHSSQVKIFQHDNTVFEDIFTRFIIEKLVSFMHSYIQGSRQDSMVILRSFIEYLLFAIWIDTVTRFWPSMETMWKTENWYDHFEAHKMSIHDHNLKMKRLKKTNAFVMLSQDEFEKKFSLEGNPADFLLFLFKPVCNQCLKRNERKHWYGRTKFLSLDGIQERFGIEKSHLSDKLDKRSFSSDKAVESEEIEDGEELASKIRLMTLLSKRAENEKVMWNFDDFHEPVFGFEHVKKCAFCHTKEVTDVILQVPSLNLVFIWLQKLYPESRLQIKKIKVLYKQLSNDFTHFSTSILPGRDEVTFKFYDEECNLFDPEEMARIFNDFSLVTLNFTSFLKKFLEYQLSETE